MHVKHMLSCSHACLFLFNSRQEEIYLNFLSSITKEVLASGMYTQSDMEVVFQKHVTNNKQKLREVLYYYK